MTAATRAGSDVLLGTGRFRRRSDGRAEARTRPRAPVVRICLFVAGGMMMCVSPFLAWIDGSGPMNDFAAIGAANHPEGALPGCLATIPLAFGLAAIVVALALRRDRRRFDSTTVVLAGVTVLVPVMWSLASWHAYAAPQAGSPGIGVYISLAGEALVVTGGVISLVRLLQGR